MCINFLSAWKICPEPSGVNQGILRRQEKPARIFLNLKELLKHPEY